MLNEAQKKAYETQGYLLLKGAISEEEVARLEKGLARNPPLDGTLAGDTQNYPEPGRYTLATNSLKDPDLAFIVEHPTLVDAARKLRVTAFPDTHQQQGSLGVLFKRFPVLSEIMSILLIRMRITMN